jgi:site-specific recombinase XerD
MIRQRQASPHTIAAYRDTFKLLLGFAFDRTAIQPSRLGVQDLTAPLVGEFLDHLETVRGNSVRTRNARLAAVHSLFRYAALQHPEYGASIQRVLAIPPKRFDRTIITYLTEPEIDALLQAADPRSWLGRRDRTMLAVAIQTGLRASELTALTIGDVHLGTGAHISVVGKGRKQRVTPLTKNTVDMLAAWLTERAATSDAPLFPTRRGARLSRDAIERRLTKHARTAAQTCPSLVGKKLSPHVLRHSTAMRLLHAGVDTTVIALWLGHESVATTQVYVHADLALKERALARTAPLTATPGRYQPTDTTIAFLDSL